MEETDSASAENAQGMFCAEFKGFAVEKGLLVACHEAVLGVVGVGDVAGLNEAIPCVVGKAQVILLGAVAVLVVGVGVFLAVYDLV